MDLYSLPLAELRKQPPSRHRSVPHACTVDAATEICLTTLSLIPRAGDKRRVGAHKFVPSGFQSLQSDPNHITAPSLSPVVPTGSGHERVEERAISISCFRNQQFATINVCDSAVINQASSCSFGQRIRLWCIPQLLGKGAASLIAFSSPHFRS